MEGQVCWMGINYLVEAGLDTQVGARVGWWVQPRYHWPPKGSRSQRRLDAVFYRCHSIALNEALLLFLIMI